jgi:hypothetical protein
VEGGRGSRYVQRVQMVYTSGPDVRISPLRLNERTGPKVEGLVVRLDRGVRISLGALEGPASGRLFFREIDAPELLPATEAIDCDATWGLPGLASDQARAHAGAR